MVASYPGTQGGKNPGYEAIKVTVGFWRAVVSLIPLGLEVRL